MHFLFSCVRVKVLKQCYQNIKCILGKRPFLNHDLSRLMGKPTICIGEKKGPDQLRSNCEADQRLCFRYSDGTIPLLLKSEISSFQLFSMLARTCRFVSDLFGNHILLVFPRGGSFYEEFGSLVVIASDSKTRCWHFLVSLLGYVILKTCPCNMQRFLKL